MTYRDDIRAHAEGQAYRRGYADARRDMVQDICSGIAAAIVFTAVMAPLAWLVTQF